MYICTYIYCLSVHSFLFKKEKNNKSVATYMHTYVARRNSMCTENAFPIFIFIIIDNLNGLLFHDLEALYLLRQNLCLTLHSGISLILIVYKVTYGI